MHINGGKYHKYNQEWGKLTWRNRSNDVKM